MTERYLLFDSGCSVCAALAREVEARSGGRLGVRSLRDPEVQALLDRARPGWRWEPMLVEIEGERVRIFTGLAMRWRLVQVLGPVRALRVAQAVARHGGPVLSVDWGRRDFLRRAGGALLGLLTLQGLGAPLRSGTAGPPIPSPSRPPSRRQVQNGEPLYSALLQQAQKQFRFETWNAEPDWKEVWLYSFEKGSALVAPLFPSGSSHRFLTASVRGEEILALYVVEIELKEGPARSGRARIAQMIQVYTPGGMSIVEIQLEDGYPVAIRPAPARRSRHFPGHAAPLRAVCCDWARLGACIAAGTVPCELGFFGNPAALLACIAAVIAGCMATLCWSC